MQNKWRRNLCSACGRRLAFVQIREGRRVWPSHWPSSAPSFRWGMQSYRITRWDAAPCGVTRRVDAAFVQLREKCFLAPAARYVFIFTCACCGSRASRSPWSGWAETKLLTLEGSYRQSGWGEEYGDGNFHLPLHGLLHPVPPKGSARGRYSLFCSCLGAPLQPCWGTSGLHLCNLVKNVGYVFSASANKLILKGGSGEKGGKSLNSTKFRIRGVTGENLWDIRLVSWFWMLFQVDSHFIAPHRS